MRSQRQQARRSNRHRDHVDVNRRLEPVILLSHRASQSPAHSAANSRIGPLVGLRLFDGGYTIISDPHSGWSWYWRIIADSRLCSWLFRIFCFSKSWYSRTPGYEPTKLVTIGPYRITRNPMYLGLELVLLGAFFLVKSPFFLIPPIVFFLLINFLQIPFEENLLTERFGDSYTEYCQRVRRWL